VHQIFPVNSFSLPYLLGFFLCAIITPIALDFLYLTLNKVPQSFFFYNSFRSSSQDALFHSGQTKPLGFMARSWGSFQTSSIEAGNCEARGLSPKNPEPSYDSFFEDYKVFMHQASRGWKQPKNFSMVTPEDKEEAKKLDGKGHVESLKLIDNPQV
jgi:hypothetical protein